MSIIKILDTWTYLKKFKPTEKPIEYVTLTVNVSGSMGGQLYINADGNRLYNTLLYNYISTPGTYTFQNIKKGSVISITDSSWDTGYSYSFDVNNNFIINSDKTINVNCSYEVSEDILYTATIRINGLYNYLQNNPIDSYSISVTDSSGGDYTSSLFDEISSSDVIYEIENTLDFYSGKQFTVSINIYYTGDLNSGNITRSGYFEKDQENNLILDLSI